MNHRNANGARYAAPLRLCLMMTLFLAAGAYAQDPALPPGLAPAGARSPESPALPPGLAPEAPASPESPALPPGLGGEPAAEQPSLPPGLEAESEVVTEAEQPETESRRLLPDWLHGYWETRAAVRIVEDDVQPDFPLGEMRLQLDAERAFGPVYVEFTGDTIVDAVLEEMDFDLRRLVASWTPVDWLDVKAGRQVLTWGTGDMLFINDLFPKDWQSFFIGRDVDYLKAPSDSIRIGVFSDLVNVDFAYTPQFAPDRYITGERISFWNPLFSRRDGEDNQVDANPPSTWFKDDEFALRLYRRFGATEVALYGYGGYWKSPGGQRFPPMQATFPKLSVYGASVRGTLGKGIGNIEIGYYDSRQDREGSNPFINNSEFRVLVGYEQELAKEFTGGIQLYLEHMMDYQAYRNTLPSALIEPKDQDRFVTTVRLTKLLMNQTLTLSLFGYLSPTDNDAYLRPKATYKINDHWTVEGGGNVFLGEHDYSFFGQFEDNTNIYASARYAF